jgi:transcriptional regulator with XRE-family HTH domain
MDQGRRAVPALTAPGRQFGAIVRGARTAQGLTLAELGHRTGYSAAQVSRYERGLAPLTDIAVLRRFADALAIAPQHLGLSAEAVRSPHPLPSPADPRSSPIRRPGNGRGSARDPGESVRPYADRGLVSRNQWNAIITSAVRELWLYGMAEYGYATDDDVPAILKRATAHGCLVRVLLLNPASPQSAVIDRDEGHPAGTLAARTQAALARFSAMRRQCGPRMRVRVYDEYPTVSVVRGDDSMLVTPYLRFFIGSNSPTFEFRSDQAPRMFTRYARHFETTWKHAEDWHP